MDLEILQSESYLIFPCSEDPLLLFSNSPCFSILCKVPPSFQNVDQVEPLFDNLPLSEQVHFVKDIQLKSSVFHLTFNLAFPSSINLLLFEFLKMLGAS